MKPSTILKKYKNFLYLLIIFPFIQLGISTYLSVQFIAFILLVLFVWRFPASKKHSVLFDAFVLSMFMFPSLFVFINSPNLYDHILRIFRELFCILILFSIINIARSHPIDLKTIVNQANWVKPLIMFLCLSFFLFAVFQFFAIKQAIRLWLPIDWYAMKDQILPDENDILYAAYTNLRPSSFFTEPSYLGFMVLSMLLIVWSIFSERAKWVLVSVLLATVLVSRSLSGVIFFFIMLFVLINFKNGFLKKINNNKVAIQGLIAVLSIFSALIILQITATPVLGRVKVILTDKTSSLFRIYYPLQMLGFALRNYPFGIPFNEYQHIFSYFPVLRIDNGLLYIGVTYGVLSIPLLIYILFKIKNPVLILFFVFSSIFNGSVFYFDKVAIMSIGMMIYILEFEKNNGYKKHSFSAVSQQINRRELA